MSKLWVIALLGLGVSGCVTPEQSAQTARLADAETCRQMGAKTADQDFSCRVTLEAQRRNENATYGAIQSAQQQQQTNAYANRLIYGR